MKVIDNCDRFRKNETFPSPGAIRASHPQYAWNERELIRVGPLVCGLHALGTRPLYEYLRELVGTDQALAADAEALLKRYAQLDPQVVETLGGRNLQMPLALVNGGLR